MLTKVLYRWVIFQLNLSGPILQILRSVSGEVGEKRSNCGVIAKNDLQIQRQATERLREYFAQPQLTEPVRTRPIERSFSETNYASDDDDNARIPSELRRRMPEPL